MGKIVLLGDRAAQIVLRYQAQTERSFAEPQSIRLLQLHDLLDVLDAELAVFRENTADAAVITSENTPRSFDRQDILLGSHRHQPGFGKARAVPLGPPSSRSLAGCQVLSTTSSGTSKFRSLRERTRRSDTSISSTIPMPSIVPTTTDSAMLRAILGWEGLPGTAAGLSTVMLVWLARLSTWLTTWRCMAVS